MEKTGRRAATFFLHIGRGSALRNCGDLGGMARGRIGEEGILSFDDGSKCSDGAGASSNAGTFYQEGCCALACRRSEGKSHSTVATLSSFGNGGAGGEFVCEQDRE